MFKGIRVIEQIGASPFAIERSCPVDQTLRNSFNKNDAGWLRNDLSALAAASTKEQYDLILSRMKELSTSSNLPKDVSFRDAFDYIKPRTMQTENEFADFSEFLTKKGIDNVNAAYAAEMARKFAEKPVEKPVEKPAE